MSRIVLVHWNAAEAEERAESLRQGGHEVSCYTDPRGNQRALSGDPPDAFVIDLARIPSQGREIGAWLRRRKTTRSVPLVFIEGEPEKTARVRALLPDATYAVWEDVSAKVAEAIAHPLAEPVVPGTMDAYSSVPLAKKLGITAGSVVALIHAPFGFEKTMSGLPDGAVILGDEEGTADVVLLFETSVDGLKTGFADAAARLNTGGRLWVVWPKKASGVESDLSQIAVRAYGLECGFVDYKIASIDETWSGLCFARRAA